MGTVVRLVTLAELREDGWPGEISVSAWLDAELSEGRRVPLLRDRGWSSKVIVARDGRGAPDDTSAGDGAVDPWTATSAEEIEATARTVVGPDEPVEGTSLQEAEAAYWAYLARLLRRQRIHVEPDELRRLPHDVVLGERLRERLRRNATRGSNGIQPDRRRVRSDDARAGAVAARGQRRADRRLSPDRGGAALSQPRIELLYFDGCPNYRQTLELVERLASELGITPSIELVAVSDPDTAMRRRFLGSPTVRVDGRDVEPGADERGEFALACRVYETDQGPAGQPAEAWIRAALERALERQQ